MFVCECFNKMPSEKSPGLKILWVWTLGTAASTLSFSYIIYLWSYTHTHTYLSFFFCSTCYECGADKTEGHGDCHERTTTTGTHFLWCASSGHGAGVWGCCARRKIIGLVYLLEFITFWFVFDGFGGLKKECVLCVCWMFWMKMWKSHLGLIYKNGSLIKDFTVIV